MALRPLVDLKNWFKTGLKPLQEQFHDWMDSFWHKSESIPIASVGGLQDALNNIDVSGTEVTVNNSHAVVIPAKSILTDIFVWVDGAKEVKIGITDGGSEVDSANVNGTFLFDLRRISAIEETLYITGNGNFNIKIFIR